MEEIYKNNFGESIEDVAQSLAIVKTNTKLSGDELKLMGERALLLRDVFEFDVNESTRSAKMLMDQFGISGEEAYNLIAQGAQAGLDKNGDLLDTINEYAVHYEQLGYTSEEFFNSLMNGAESGTFSVDKLGDAMKEFGIRAKDTANTTTEGFELLGLDADLMRDKFAQGGESAREATEKTLEALFSMDDAVKQNQAGVDLFGTMWEDLGIEGVKALMDVTGEASLTSDALEKMNEVKYDDIGSSLKELGRTVETDIVQPLGEELKQVVEDVIGFVKDNAPGIKDVIAGVVEKVGELIGWIVDHGSEVLSTIAGIGAGFITWKVASMINGVVTAIKAFKLANEGATISQAILNGVMKANPLILIASLIATVVTAIITFIATNENARKKVAEVWNKIKEIVGGVIDAVVGFFKSAWNTIVEVWSVCTEFFSGLWEGIKNVFATVGEFFLGIWEVIKAIFTPAIEWFSKLFSSIYNTLKSIVDVIVGLLKGCWTIITTVFGVAFEWFNNTVITPIKKVFTTLWNTISSLASNTWNAIKGVWNAVTGWFTNTIINPIKNLFTGLWDKLKSGASGAWEGIKSVFSTVTSWFSNVFSNAWQAVKNVFSTGGQIFTGIKDGIVNGFKVVVNAIINGINKVVAVPFNAINTVLQKIHDVSIMGIKPFGFVGTISVPQIPTLARGGIVDGATTFIAGEHGKEAVIPLEHNTEWLDKVAKRLYEYKEPQSINQTNALLSKLSDIDKPLDNLNQSIVLDSGVLVGETINQIDQRLARNYSMKARGI